MGNRVSPTLKHKKGKNTRSFVVYTVWNNKTDELIICDGTAPECAKAMGMTLGSFYSMICNEKTGRIKKWTISPTYLEGRDRGEIDLKEKNMKAYDETEQSYKNGYEAGVKDFAERLKGCLLERDDDTIDNIAEWLIDKQRKEDGKNG